MRLILLTILLFIVSLAQSQVYERYRVEEVKVSYPERLSVGWANDVFFQTDRYFTNGLVIEYHSQKLERLAAAKLLFDPMSESGPIYSLSLIHDIYTPKNVLGDPLQTDRPYAGLLLLGLKATHFSPQKKYRFSSEIQAGLLGEYAGGRFVQNGIHVLLPASEPIPGWAYQIQHDLCVQYNIEVEKLFLHHKWFELDGLAKSRLGLPFTDFTGGLRLRAGLGPDYYSTDHLLSKSANSVYFFTEARLRTVFFDATIQGGALNDKSPHTIMNINPFVAEMKAGIAGRYSNLMAEMGAEMFSPKFSGALSHRWVYFKFGILF